MKNLEINISNKMIDTCQLPKEVLLGASIISMTGNTDIFIENFKSIIKYQTDLLLIQGKRNPIQISSKNLQLKQYTKEELKIHGMIREIKFLYFLIRRTF